MNRLSIIAISIITIVSTTAAAEPARFQFKKDDTLTYTIVQSTKAVETTIDEKTKAQVEQEHFTKHTVVRRWKVADVDPKGVATLEMSILSMKWERKLPNGEMDVFDSTKPDPNVKNELGNLIGPVVAVLRLDDAGKVVEVKESKFGPPSRFAIDLPFKIVLPPSGPVQGQTWDRGFTIKLDPPHGTGETYEATQKYTVKAPSNGLLVIGMSTTLKEPPTQAAEQIPLFPMLLEGDVYFHEATGKYSGARLKLKKELTNHAGEGSKYVYESTYAEDLKQ